MEVIYKKIYKVVEFYCFIIFVPNQKCNRASVSLNLDELHFLYRESSMSGFTVVFDFNRFFTVLDGNGRERTRSARQRSKEQEDLRAANVHEEDVYQKESDNTPKAEDRAPKSQSSSERSWSQHERRDGEQEGKHEWYSWAWTQSSGTNTTADSAASDEDKAGPQSQGSFVSSNGWERIFVPGEEFMVDWRKWLLDRGLLPAEAPSEQDMTSVYYEGTGRLAEEARREAAETAKILWELRPQLEELARAARSSPESLLRHVYSRHPPRNRGAAAVAVPPPTGCPPAALRRSLLGAIRAYHEDKNREAEHGRRWHLLCREITKHLIEQLELFD